jgi:hypothetical protein
MRKAGVDNSDSNSYIRKGFFAGGSLGLSANTANLFDPNVVNNSSTRPSAGFIEVYQPKVNNQTLFVVNFYDNNGDQYFGNAGRHTTVDTFDSMTFAISTGTMTGSYSVYGFNI